jgi:DNA (cytosine-5)-methyltransferase 1
MQKGNVHPEEDRFLTIDELKLIASYPKEFILKGSYKEKWARIGNSVPPLFMRSIAQNIQMQLLRGI